MNNSLKWLLLLVFSVNVLCAQTAREVDSIVKTYPKSTSSVIRLSDRIKKDFTTDFAKARAIFTWIASNISYDVDFYQTLNNNPSFVYIGKTDRQIDESVINQVLVKRKAVCDGYSRLFNRLAELVGLEAQSINGRAKVSASEIGSNQHESNHTWNIVKIDGVWRLMDVTWAAGGLNFDSMKFKKGFNSFYFDTPEALFFLSHYPEDGLWNSKNVSLERFINAPFFFYEDQNSAYQIIEPFSGIVTVIKGQKVLFKIKNLTENNSVHYNSKPSGYTSMIGKKGTDGIMEFEITADESLPDYLTIYIDNSSFVTYKVNLK